MRAAVLRETGTPLSVEDVAEPDVAEGQSVVEVRAAGINFADVLIKNGMYPQPPELPAVLGNEIAGDIGDRRVIAFARLSGDLHFDRELIVLVQLRVDGNQMHARRHNPFEVLENLGPRK